MSREFNPSQVYLGVPPLTGTMDHSEREHAAALIVRACQVLGDKWQPIEPRQIGEIIEADIDRGINPIASLNRNPFFKPDFYELADGVFGRWVGEAGTGAIELTPQGVEALRRHVSEPA